MLSQGALSITKEELLNTLRLNYLQSLDINDQYKNLLNYFPFSGNGLLLSIANSIWLKKGLGFKQTFLEETKTYYNANICNLDFSSPNSKETINNWATSNTNGKILEIVDSLDPKCLVILLNAIYFKANWENKFNPQKTKPEAFYLKNDKIKLVPMMFSENEVECFFGKNFVAVSLPYAGNSLDMCLFLPNKDVDLKELIQNLGQEKLQEYFSKPWEKQSRIAIPKFKIEFSLDLIEPLLSLGIKSAFSSKANFQAMVDTSEPLSIGKVLQKTFLEVNEEGSEAAAVTLSMTIVAGLPSILTFDRPFFYLIRDKSTGIILFIGTLIDPDPSSQELTKDEQKAILEEEKLKAELGIFQYTIKKEMERHSQEKKEENYSDKSNKIKPALIFALIFTLIFLATLLTIVLLYKL